MGQDENKNDGTAMPNPAPTPTLTPNPRATFTSGNHLGMRPSRDLSAQEELDRISASSTPTQDSNGDIVLDNPTPKKSNKKRILIVILIITVLAAVVGAGIFLILQQNNSVGSSTVTQQKTVQDNEVKELINQYADDVEQLEDVFVDISKNRLYGAIFEEESKTVLDKYLKSNSSFYNGIKDKDSVSEAIAEDFKALKERMEKNVAIYDKAYKIYQNYYSALKNKDASLISEYLNSSDEGEKTAAEAYTLYINGQGNSEELLTIYDHNDYVKGIFGNTTRDLVENDIITELITKIKDWLGNDEE